MGHTDGARCVFTGISTSTHHGSVKYRKKLSSIGDRGLTDRVTYSAFTLATCCHTCCHTSCRTCRQCERTRTQVEQLVASVNGSIEIHGEQQVERLVWQHVWQHVASVKAL